MTTPSATDDAARTVTTVQLLIGYGCAARFPLHVFGGDVAKVVDIMACFGESAMGNRKIAQQFGDKADENNRRLLNDSLRFAVHGMAELWQAHDPEDLLPYQAWAPITEQAVTCAEALVSQFWGRGGPAPTLMATLQNATAVLAAGQFLLAQGEPDWDEGINDSAAAKGPIVRQVFTTKPEDPTIAQFFARIANQRTPIRLPDSGPVTDLCRGVAQQLEGVINLCTRDSVAAGRTSGLLFAFRAMRTRFNGMFELAAETAVAGTP